MLQMQEKLVITIEDMIEFITANTQIPLTEKWVEIKLAAYNRLYNSIFVILSNPSPVGGERPAILVLDNKLNVIKFANFADIIQGKFVPEEIAILKNREILNFSIHDSGKIQLDILDPHDHSPVTYRSIGSIFSDQRRIGKAIGQRKEFDLPDGVPRYTKRLSLRLPYFLGASEYVMRERMDSDHTQIWLSSGDKNNLLFDDIELQRELYPVLYPHNGVYNRSGIYIYPHHGEMLQIHIVPDNDEARYYLMKYPNASVEKASLDKPDAQLAAVLCSSVFDIVEYPMQVQISRKIRKSTDLVLGLELDKLISPLVIPSPTSHKVLIFAFQIEADVKGDFYQILDDFIESYADRLRLRGEDDEIIISDSFQRAVTREEIFMRVDWNKMLKKYAYDPKQATCLFNKINEVDAELFDFKGWICDLETGTVTELPDCFWKVMRQTGIPLHQWPLGWLNTYPDALFTWGLHPEGEATFVDGDPDKESGTALGVYNLQSPDCSFHPFLQTESLKNYNPNRRIWITRKDEWLLVQGIGDNGKIYSIQEFAKQVL